RGARDFDAYLRDFPSQGNAEYLEALREMARPGRVRFNGRRGLRIQPGVCAGHDQCVRMFPDPFFERQADFVRQPWGLSVARDRQALGQSDGSEGAMGGEAWERVLREG